MRSLSVIHHGNARVTVVHMQPGHARLQVDYYALSKNTGHRHWMRLTEAIYFDGLDLHPKQVTRLRSYDVDPDDVCAAIEKALAPVRLMQL